VSTGTARRDASAHPGTGHRARTRLRHRPYGVVAVLAAAGATAAVTGAPGWLWFVAAASAAYALAASP
jgi:hypothetical protein